MANYNSFTRSNGFNVKNENLFRNEATEIGVIDFFEYYDGQFHVATYDGLYTCDNDGNELEHEDICNFICKHVVDGTELFIEEVGHEKLRYLSSGLTLIVPGYFVYIDAFRNGKEKLLEMVR